MSLARSNRDLQNIPLKSGDYRFKVVAKAQISTPSAAFTVALGVVVRSLTHYWDEAIAGFSWLFMLVGLNFQN